MKVSYFTLLLSLAVLLPLATSQAFAENSEKQTGDTETVELFQAVDDGLIEVKLSARSSHEGSISVTNKSGRPLVIDMPSAFAGVPVLAQPGGMMMGAGPMPGMGLGAMPGGDLMGGGRGGRGGGMGGLGGMMGGSRGGGMGGSSGGNQSVGGGMGGMGGRGGDMGGMGGMGGRGGGGLMAIAPEKTEREKVRLVCLEHGKKDPRPNVKYTLVPIDSYTDNKTTQVLCGMLGNNDISQMALQAAVWNQENGLTYEEMAAKKVRENSRTLEHAYFNAEDLAISQELLALAAERAEELQKVEDAQKELEEEQKDNVKIDNTVENMTEDLL